MLKLLIVIGLIGSLYRPGFTENRIDIEQVGDINTATTSQVGDDNLIAGATSGGAINPAIAALQDSSSSGGANTLIVRQTGDGNELGVYQKGNETLLDVTQSGGSELGIHVDVGGANKITVTQTGGATAIIKHGPDAGGSLTCPGDPPC